MAVLGKTIGEGFYETPESGQEQIGNVSGDISVTKQYRGPYANRFRFIQNFITNNRVVRLQYAGWPIFADQITISGERNPSNDGVVGYIEFDDAIIDVEFKSFPARFFGGTVGGNVDDDPQLDPENVFEDSVVTETVYRELVDTRFEFEKQAGGEVSDQTRSVLFADPVVRYSLTLAKQRNPKWLQIAQVTGEVNDAAIVFPNRLGASAKFARFDGVSGERVIDTNVLNNQDVNALNDFQMLTYTFALRVKLNWNQVPQLSQTDPPVVQFVSVTPEPHNPVDFHIMFAGTKYADILKGGFF